MAGSNFFSPISSTCSVALIEGSDSSSLAVLAKCTGAPPTTASTFEHGCIIIRTDSGTGNAAVYENVGSSAVPSWNLIGSITPGEIALAEGSVLVGSASAVATAVVAKTSGQILVGNGTTIASVAVSGDATISSAGAVTVTGAAAAFNVGTNQTWTKEVAHTSTVTASTTAATAGGDLSFAAGAGSTTGTGGAVSMSGGAGGSDAVGGAASITGGAAGGGNRAGGAVAITGGAGTGTGAGGALAITSGASANGAGVSPGASGDIIIRPGAPGTATTGTGGASGNVTIQSRGGGSSTGASSVGGSGSSISLNSGGGGASSGGGDTGGAAGNITLGIGPGGAGATSGRPGAIFMRPGFGALVLTKVAAPTAKTTNATLTTAEILGRWVTVNQGAGGTSTLTTPTGTELAAAFPAALLAGDSFDFTIINISTAGAEDAILAPGTDVSIVGNATVNSNDAIGTQSQGTFRFRYSGSNIWVAYRV